ncbi:hypothetical protein [Octadecabacter temperatus]|nr:hypothetical protein [Octadecabacter temperatus]
MAQDCVDAMIYAADVDPLTQDRALDYLTQMESYRSVVTSMLTERASNPAPWLAGENGSVRRVLQPVSRAGAYLIARDMGLVEQHEDWTQWRRSAALPLFRLDEMTSSRHHN